MVYGLATGSAAGSPSRSASSAPENLSDFELQTIGMSDRNIKHQFDVKRPFKGPAVDVSSLAEESF